MKQAFIIRKGNKFWAESYGMFIDDIESATHYMTSATAYGVIVEYKDRMNNTEIVEVYVSKH
jgi:hypothetical protein